ncbi:hypothetical protein OROGR_032623 [Orobanche gracilis]
MAGTSIIAVYKSCSAGLCAKPYPTRSQAALSWNPISRLSLSSKLNNGAISFLSNKTRSLQSDNNRTKRNSFAVYANSVPGAPSPSGPPSSNSMSWIIGLVVTFVLPFLTNKWGPLWVLKNRVLGAVQTVEDVVEAVERVAEKVDEIAEEIGDDLPQGKLKDLVELVEHVAEKTAKTADCLDNVIDKAQEAEVQLEDMIAQKKAKSSPAEEDKAQEISDQTDKS